VHETCHACFKAMFTMAALRTERELCWLAVLQSLARLAGLGLRSSAPQLHQDWFMCRVPVTYHSRSSFVAKHRQIPILLFRIPILPCPCALMCPDVPWADDASKFSPSICFVFSPTLNRRLCVDSLSMSYLFSSESLRCFYTMWYT